MITIPNSETYEDPIRYLRDFHAMLLQLLSRLEELARLAEKTGLLTSLESERDWEEILEFFENSIAEHEIDEEEAIFNPLEKKLPHIGFQPADSPFRFLIDGHGALSAKTIAAAETWRAILNGPPEEIDSKSGAFLAAIRDMVTLYREHIHIEEERAYDVADKEFSPSEKIYAMRLIRERQHQGLKMPTLGFSSPNIMPVLGNLEYLSEQETLPDLVAFETYGTTPEETVEEDE